jgi:hypothetical protein
MAGTYPSLLLVEGRDDAFVIAHLLNHYYRMENDTQGKRNQYINRLVVAGKKLAIKDKEGYNNIREDLDTEIDGSGLERLGIVVDADDDLSSRWQALTDVLLQIGYSNIPDKPLQAGTIIEAEGNLPRIGLWIMPDNSLPGMLEDFVSFLVPGRESNPIWKLAESSIKEACTISPQIPPKKGLIHTWLAWQEDPGTPLGLAITKKYLDAQATHAKQFVAWLHLLFDLS